MPYIAIKNPTTSTWGIMTQAKNLYSNLPFFTERMKIIDNCEILVRNLYDEENYVIYIRTLKETLDHVPILTKAKNDFEKDFSKLMNNSVFGMTMDNVRNHRGMSFVAADRKRNRLVAEGNYHTTKLFSENLLAVEITKQTKMNKSVYLGFNYSYEQDSSTWVLVWPYKTKVWRQKIDGLLFIGKNKKVIGLMKDELGGRIMKEFVEPKIWIYSSLIDNDHVDKRVTGTKVVCNETRN